MNILCLLVIAFPAFALASATISETYEFQVRGTIFHRCYAGFPGKPPVSAKCDNKDYKKTVLDKIIAIKMVDEPDPENSKSLAGGVIEKFEFKGQKFVVAISLFKDSGSEPYRVRMVADRDGLKSEGHAIFSDLKNPKDLNKLSIEYFSNGDRDTVKLWATIEPHAGK